MIQHRWSRSDKEYLECLYGLSLGQREVVLLPLLKNRQKREFLLNFVFVSVIIITIISLIFSDFSFS